MWQPCMASPDLRNIDQLADAVRMLLLGAIEPEGICCPELCDSDSTKHLEFQNLGARGMQAELSNSSDVAEGFGDPGQVLGHAG